MNGTDRGESPAHLLPYSGRNVGCHTDKKQRALLLTLPINTQKSICVCDYVFTHIIHMHYLCLFTPVMSYYFYTQTC